VTGRGAPVPLVALGGVLLGCGVYLLLARTLSRLVLGMVLAGNGINALLLAAGGPGPDPLTQAMVLTAIVIALALTAFLLALAYRTWRLTGSDLVADDAEDRRIALQAHRADLREERRAARGRYRAQRREAFAEGRARRRELREALRAGRRELRARVRLERAVAARAEDLELVEEPADSDFEHRPGP
jgi:multicomponent Na+:H+ antiporter subunit C